MELGRRQPPQIWLQDLREKEKEYDEVSEAFRKVSDKLAMPGKDGED